MKWPEFFLFNQRTREIYRALISPALRVLVRLNIHPNAITTAGLLFSVVAGVVFSTGNIYLGVWMLACAGTCDILDGQLARETGRISAFGAFYDSCVDRLSDAAILMGLAWYFAGGPALFWSANIGHPESHSPFTVLMILMALNGAFVTSYIKARAEAAGTTCNVGRMQRPERFIFLLVASTLGSIPGIGLMLLKMSLALFALLTNLTAIHRFIHVGRLIRDDNAC